MCYHRDDAGATMETMQAHIDNLMSILKAQPYYSSGHQKVYVFFIMPLASHG